jgi:hypothetical protein
VGGKGRDAAPLVRGRHTWVVEGSESGLGSKLPATAWDRERGVALLERRFATGLLTAERTSPPGYDRSNSAFTRTGRPELRAIVAIADTLGDGSGARILVTVQSHVTVANGELRIEHEQVNFRRVGKRS